MPGGVLPYQSTYITRELTEYMSGFDFRIGTLEAAIGTGFSFDPVKMRGRQNIIYARNEDFFRVKEMGFDVVSLANNHVWDLGEEGLKNTIGVLQRNGIKYCGAGMNAEEASRPVVIEKGGLKVAIFAYCMYDSTWMGYVEFATEEKAGVNPLRIDQVVKDIQEAKEVYDRVIVLPHWGQEYRYEPLPECLAMAKEMVKAGADAVLGSHSHQIQPFVHIKGKPVCFSMGNFLFPDFFMYPPRPMWYPESPEEINGVKEVVGYPYPIHQPIKRVWNSVSRFGCTVGLELDARKMRVSIRYVSLSDSNVESFSDLTPVMHRRLRKCGWTISSALFRFVLKCRRRFRSLMRRR